MREEGAQIAGKVHAGGELIAEAEIFFAHLDQSRSQQLFGDHNFVFSGELKHLLGLAKIAAQGVVVVRSSRVGDGRVIREDNWQEPGMVAADNLSPHKAAWLLALALTKTRDPDAIQRLFDEY